MLPGFGGDKHPPTHTAVGEKGGTPYGSRTWGVVGFPQENTHGDLQQKNAINAEVSGSQSSQGKKGSVLEHNDTPGGAVPHWAGARCLPPALVAWGAAVPTLTSPGTMLTAAAPETHDIRSHTHPNLLHL